MINITPMADLLSFTQAAKLCRLHGLKCNTPRTFHRYIERHPKVCRVWRRLPGMTADAYHLRLVDRMDVLQLIKCELNRRLSCKIKNNHSPLCAQRQ